MLKLDRINREEFINQIILALNDQDIQSFRRDFLELHPTDQIEIFMMLSEEQRLTVYQYLSPAEFADIFQGMELKEQKELILEVDHQYAVDIFNNMYSDDVAAFLGELDGTKAKLFLDQMTIEDAEDVIELLAYPPETAGAIMTTEFVSIAVSDTVSEVIERLREDAPEAETIYYIYVVDKAGHLVGVVSLRDLIISKLDQRIGEIMSTRVVSVPVLTDQEEVANVIKNYDFLAVPVVTPQQQLVGIVTVDDVIDVLEDETTEDFAEIVAAKGTVDLEISAFEAAKKRLPWLIILLFIGMFTASLIGRFERTLESVAILAVFMPLIAGMAGNTGTQSLAVVVRGLALDKFDKQAVWRLIRREATTGLMIGLVCGVVVAIISQFITHGNLFLGFVIGFSLFCTLIVSSLAGTIIPLLIDKLKIDPAVASGPFITTINDIVALTIYFSIATAFLQYLI